MSIINRYIIKDILKFFGLLLVMVISITMVIDFFSKFGHFIDAGLPVSMALQFFLYRIPFIVFKFTPVGMVLSVLITLGLMNKNNELVALNSSGVSIYSILKPVAYLSLLIGAFVFIISDFIVPSTITKANIMWAKSVKREAEVVLKQRNIWVKGYRSIFHIKNYFLHEKIITGISLYYFDQDFKLIRRVDAKKGYFKDGQWVIEEVMEQILDNKTGEYKILFHKEMDEKFGFLPDDLKEIVKKGEEMSLAELSKYIKEIEREKYNATNYIVSYHAKIAFPVACIIMCISATGIAVRRKMRDKLSLIIASGIGMMFIFYGFYYFCLSLGNGGVLPPLVAAWLANLILLCFSFYLLLTAE